ncbi:glycoside hydrolase family 73 protein [Peptostreptococcus canis]|uniref:Mannosyl-glycoprotein endo-beta-N-acetylglucosamidase n=1 Tax=Peptostreptococcus canis TaxID=1159213 RepID=A0ABR6TL96_9FIRM|nr:glucosaminidase domain-containing protein [Peptostreptococcus canis]MBC2575928.1 mannosyl-glycoprotein endo-beta-N-acetylglucosamidase [Peptostreptococcus canis]MBP1997951.1 flagellum-specific peptidoglycan hydrolase FlgJ [Peptostreptococcus canis]
MVQLERRKKSYNKKSSKSISDKTGKYINKKNGYNKTSKRYTKKRNYRNNAKNKKKIKRRRVIRNAIFIVILLLIMYFLTTLFSFIENTQNNKENITPDDFISKIEEPAINGYRKTGILPSITMSQAILESNWGRSELAKKGNNLYGIKADKSWHGKKIEFNTKEYYNKYENAYFRQYNSWDDSIEDYHNFLLKNERYRKNGLFDAKNYQNQAQALENAGYATTINSRGEKIYADKLIKIIESRNLYKYDKKVKGTLQ